VPFPLLSTKVGAIALKQVKGESRRHRHFSYRHRRTGRHRKIKKRSPWHQIKASLFLFSTNEGAIALK
jgi:hypothetical protein